MEVKGHLLCRNTEAKHQRIATARIGSSNCAQISHGPTPIVFKGN